MTAALGVVLVTLVGAAMILPKDIVISSWIGLTSLLFIAVYLVSVRLIYLNERNHPEADAGHDAPDSTGEGAMPLGRIIGWYVLLAAVIIGAALALPHFADRLAEHTGLGRTFVGTFLLAASTSLPEIAVSLAAVRMGSIDMAVGNLLGSNLFNVLILAIDDMVYTKGHILKDATPYHMLSVLGTILMTAVVIIGITFQVKGKKFLLALDSAVVLLIYLLNLFLLFRFTA
jgi:cation:H+ antiporter